VRLVYAVGNAGANGEVQCRARTRSAYTLTHHRLVHRRLEGFARRRAARSPAPQRTALQTQLNSICDGAENLALALNKIAGTKNPC
jgi:hypothetical protein